MASAAAIARTIRVDPLALFFMGCRLVATTELLSRSRFRLICGNATCLPHELGRAPPLLDSVAGDHDATGDFRRDGGDDTSHGRVRRLPYRRDGFRWPT